MQSFIKCKEYICMRRPYFSFPRSEERTVGYWATTPRPLSLGHGSDASTWDVAVNPDEICSGTRSRLEGVESLSLASHCAECAVHRAIL